jgi:hypothetical protein
MPGCQHTQVHALQRVSAGLALTLLLVGAGGVPAGAQGTLDFARQLYNQGRYEQALTAARGLRTGPSADAANLILGRAYLEHYRATEDRADLVAGREALRDVRPVRLGPADRVDYLVGLGEALYLDESYGAAAAMFDSALERSRALGARTEERVFDWWATAADRSAQSAVAGDRLAIYQVIRDRSRDELGRSPGSAAACYWLVVAYRSLGELGRAWDAAVAGWVRAPLTEDQGVALRADLDKQVLQGIIPERAKEMASSDAADRERVAASLIDAWETMKRSWTGR